MKKEKRCESDMKKQKKKIGMLAVIVILILLLVPLSFAAYTSVTSARRVVSTASAANVLFSSNYLQILPKEQKDYKNISVSYQEGNDTQAIYVSVCNYAQGYLSKWSEKDIRYHIEFKLVDLEKHEPITAENSYTDKSGNTVSGADVLEKNFMVAEGIATSGRDPIPATYVEKTLTSQPNTASQNMYTIFMDTTYADIVGVQVEVITEDDSPSYAAYGLYGVLSLSSYETAQTTGWNGQIQEADSGKNPSAYTGFNYEVSGSGAGTVTVTWDPDKFAISQIFLENMKKYITSSDKKSVTFKVGEEDQEDRFFIQFYRNGADKANDWETLKSYFTCDFEEEKTGE